MSFVKVASTSELSAGTIKQFDVDGKKILIANANGSFYALDNKCPHIGKPLDKGTLNGCTLTCAYHGAQFDVRDGKNLKDAKLLFLKISCNNAKTYGVKVDGSDILVEQ